jgi:hypothetical protein
MTTKSDEPIVSKRRARKIHLKQTPEKERTRARRLAEKMRTVCQRCNVTLICETSGAKRGEDVYEPDGQGMQTRFRSCICNDCGRWTVHFPGIGKTEVPKFCKIVEAMQHRRELKKAEYSYFTAGFDEKCGCVDDLARPNFRPKRQRKQMRKWRKKR